MTTGQPGASAEAIARHYDLPVDFYRLWLGRDLVYSCASWDGADSVEEAQRQKLDWFAQRLQVSGQRVLDVGCGWGALLDRFVREHGAAGGVGLTLSQPQVDVCESRRVPGVRYLLQHWADHDPTAAYDVVTAIESTEHFASDTDTADEKVAIYRQFFQRVADWLTTGGRVGLSLICLDNVGHERSTKPGPVTDLIRSEIFRESMSPSLGEMVLGWETHFELVEFHEASEEYRRTFRAWARAMRANRTQAVTLAGEDVTRTFERYLAACELLFRTREQALYRVVLTKRPSPKQWLVPLWPSDTTEPAPTASVEAVRHHYDVSNEFYELWIGPSMLYSSGMWSPGDTLESANARKIDYFAEHAVVRGRVLDIGCGWGANLRRLVAGGHASEAVGLTLSAAQRDYLVSNPIPDTEILLQSWQEHRPSRSYDAILSFGAFEHFARDGSTGPQRVAAYRQFFASCHDWLAPGGRLGVETIAHDNAPDTNAPLGRGPLGDAVMREFPESLCPHLGEVVLGFEPWFEIEVLRSDPDDFARTFRAWHVRLADRAEEASGVVDAATVRRFRQYLAATEIQFRSRILTNLRIVLRRRASRRR